MGLASTKTSKWTTWQEDGVSILMCWDREPHVHVPVSRVPVCSMRLSMKIENMAVSTNHARNSRELEFFTAARNESAWKSRAKKKKKKLIRMPYCMEKKTISVNQSYFSYHATFHGVQWSIRRVIFLFSLASLMHGRDIFEVFRFHVLRRPCKRNFGSLHKALNVERSSTDFLGSFMA